MAATIESVQGLQGVLVKVGLGEPASRAFVVGVLVGVTAYAFRMPAGAFDEDGKMRPFKAISRSPDACYTHFLSVPIGAAVGAYIFT